MKKNKIYTVEIKAEAMYDDIEAKDEEEAEQIALDRFFGGDYEVTDLDTEENDDQ